MNTSPTLISLNAVCKRANMRGMEMLAENFVENLNAAIARQEISQRELSRRSGVHFVTINRILARETDPSLLVCEKLAIAVGISPEKIFGPIAKSA